MRRRRGGLFARLIYKSRAIPPSRLLVFLGGMCLMSLSALLILSSGLQSNSLPRRPPSLFGPSTHKPPLSTNPTESGTGWFTSWKWRNPFSSNIKATEGRSALPPLLDRCPVYTFYEKKVGAQGEIEDQIEDQMLLAWRRAFWAQGFKPMVLGMAEAKEHGLYPSVRGKFKPELESELMRWLAWGRAGTGGVLIDYRIIPMAPRGDYVLSSLRRCEATFVTRYEGWGHRLFSADKDSIETLLKHIASNTLENVTTIEDASVEANEGLIRIEPIPLSFADYTPAIVKERYPTLAPAILPSLVNAHLHELFLRTYSEGVTVIAPFPKDLFPVNNPIAIFAERLSSCPKNPLSGSCPTNDKKCLPCKKIPVTSKPHTEQGPHTFALGAVPHPYTFISLTNRTFNLGADRRRSIRFLLQEVGRDQWLRSITSPPIASGVGAAPRVLALKSTIAASPSNFSSLWTVAETAEAPMSEEDVPWTFGFTIPSIKDLGLGVPRMRGDEAGLYDTVLKEVYRWKHGSGDTRLRWAVEAWNLGCAEAWKFTGAFAERAVQERKKWSSVEKKFGKGLSSEEKKGKRFLV